MHLLLASTGQQSEITLGLRLADGTSEQIGVVVPPWRSVAPDGKDIGAFCRYARTSIDDDAAAPVALYHRVIASGNGRAISLELPKEPTVKIMAITVESEEAAIGLQEDHH